MDTAAAAAVRLPMHLLNPWLPPSLRESQQALQRLADLLARPFPTGSLAATGMFTARVGSFHHELRIAKVDRLPFDVARPFIDAAVSSGTLHAPIAEQISAHANRADANRKSVRQSADGVSGASVPSEQRSIDDDLVRRVMAMQFQIVARWLQQKTVEVCKLWVRQLQQRTEEIALFFVDGTYHTRDLKRDIENIFRTSSEYIDALPEWACRSDVGDEPMVSLAVPLVLDLGLFDALHQSILLHGYECAAPRMYPLYPTNTPAPPLPPTADTDVGKGEPQRNAVFRSRWWLNTMRVVRETIQATRFFTVLDEDGGAAMLAAEDPSWAQASTSSLGQPSTHLNVSRTYSRNSDIARASHNATIAADLDVIDVDLDQEDDADRGRPSEGDEICREPMAYTAEDAFIETGRHCVDVVARIVVDGTAIPRQCRSDDDAKAIPAVHLPAYYPPRDDVDEQQSESSRFATGRAGKRPRDDTSTVDDSGSLNSAAPRDNVARDTTASASSAAGEAVAVATSSMRHRAPATTATTRKPTKTFTASTAKTHKVAAFLQGIAPAATTAQQTPASRPVVRQRKPCGVGFPGLPFDVQRSVLVFLTPRGLRSAQCTCRRWASIVQDHPWMARAAWLSLALRRRLEYHMREDWGERFASIAELDKERWQAEDAAGNEAAALARLAPGR